jgi:maleylpyruvate isomerase
MSTRGSAARPNAMLDQVSRGTAVFEACVARIGDRDLREPSHLSGWTRAHAIAHVARNADALVNLVTWARTGIETPMYASPGRRAEEIEESAQLPPEELRADLRAADVRFADALAMLPDDRWDAQVRTVRGRLVPASEVAWMRVREVWVHAVDLDAGTRFHDIPREVCIALLDDIATAFRTRDGVPPVILRARDDDRTWHLSAPGGRADSVTVSGDIASLAAYATGRPVPGTLHPANGAQVPTLPAWL